MPRPGFHTIRTAALLLAAGAALGLGAQPPAHAQPVRAAAGASRPAEHDFDGRTFGGLRLNTPVAAQQGNILLGGSRVWVWEEDGPSPSGSGGASGATRRLLLRGDVSVSLGVYRFSAAQASVWIEQLADPADRAANPDDPAAPLPRSRQVAIFLDRASDPGGDAGFSVAGDRLLVTAVIRGDLNLRYDVLDRQRPESAGDVNRPASGSAADSSRNEAAAFRQESERRLARHLRKLTGTEPDDESGDSEGPDPAALRDPSAYGPLRPIRPGVSRPYEPNSPIVQAAESVGRFGAPSPSPLAPVEKLQPIFARGGTISVALSNDRLIAPTPLSVDSDPAAAPADAAAPLRIIDAGNGERAIMLSGGVVVQYSSPRGAGTSSSIEISATRAVIFLANTGDNADQLVSFSFDTDSIKGIYLEGDVVAVSGDYTLRGPRIYYDVQNQQAVMPEAVFHTFDAKRGLPFYVRARSIRQLADKQWQAEGARLATTSFTDPVFALGARSVTITQRDSGGGGGASRSRPRDAQRGAREGELVRLGRDQTFDAGSGGVEVLSGEGQAGGGEVGAGTFVDARGITLQAGGLPFFVIPRFKGEVSNIPLRDLRFENSSSSGAAVKTAWDIFSTSGLTPPRGFEANLLADWYFDRGAGLGIESNWKRPDSELFGGEGSLLAYTLPTDWGIDVLSSGVKRGRDSEFRALVIGDHSWRLSERWTLQIEGNIISDENFVDAFFKPLAYQGREVTNAAYLKYQDDYALFSTLVKGASNDFTVNQYLLQSQGYTVDKLPEFAYFRAGDDLLYQSAPGALVWSSEYRLSRMGLRFTQPTADELGFDTPARARAAFGFDDPNQSPADALWNGGYREGSILRADTRQEVTSTLEAGPVKISPFVTGRFTAYDDRDKFNAFGPDFDSEGPMRVWYATGIRTSTQIHAVNDSIDSSLFDLHRTRHIVEPNVTVWYAGANLSQSDLPVYDDQVESLQSGAAVRAGLDQTWQTKRGGPGRWRNVDFLKANIAIVESSGDADKETPLGRFFEYRPEYSTLGTYASADLAWQLTDTVGITADTIYDLDINQPAHTAAGGLIQHSPDFASYVEVRYLNALDVTYLNFGFDYKLTRRYLVALNATYDTDENDFQDTNFSIRRKVPEAAVGLSFGYNNITDETSFGLIFEPAAVDAQRPSDRLRDIGR